MKANTVVTLLCAAILWTGCASKPHSASADAKPRRALAHFTAPEQQQKILEEKIKVKLFALENLEQEKPPVRRQLNEVMGFLPAADLQKQADAARAGIQKDQTYADALRSFYLALSNRQQAVTAEINFYRAALTNHVASRETNVVSKK